MNENHHRRLVAGFRHVDNLLDEAGHILAADIEENVCPVCRTSANSDSDYFARAFGESRRFAATSEAVTDAVGNSSNMFLLLRLWVLRQPLNA